MCEEKIHIFVETQKSNQDVFRDVVVVQHTESVFIFQQEKV